MTSDPDLNIDWQVETDSPLVSRGHQSYLSFKEFKAKYGKIDINYK